MKVAQKVPHTHTHTRTHTHTLSRKEGCVACSARANIVRFIYDECAIWFGGIIVRKERYLLRPFEVRSSKIQVTRPYFYKTFFGGAHEQIYGMTDIDINTQQALNHTVIMTDENSNKMWHLYRRAIRGKNKFKQAGRRHGSLASSGKSVDLCSKRHVRNI